MKTKKKYKTTMAIALYRHGVSIFYACYNYVRGRGKKCDQRDDGQHCMKCQYCKAEMSAYDATRMLTVFGRTKK